MMDVSTFSNLGIPLSLVTQLGFYFVLGIYAVFTAILYYHWQSYGTDAKVTSLTYIVYLATTVPLLIVMGLMVLII